MTQTIAHEIAVCEVLRRRSPTGADQPSTPWTCEACGGRQDRFVYRMWAAVLEPTHRHEYRRDIADWWCHDCDTVSDSCTQTNPA